MVDVTPSCTMNATSNIADDRYDSLDDSTSTPGSAVDGEAFPVTLHKMLCNMAAEGTEHIISWNPDGNSFTIHEPKAFVDTIMFRYFKNQTRYKSFQRQLNLYRFKRNPSGKVKGVYSHTSFRRNDRSLCNFVRRARKPSRRSRSSRNIVPEVQPIRSSSAAFENTSQAILPTKFGLTSSAIDECPSAGYSALMQAPQMKPSCESFAKAAVTPSSNYSSWPFAPSIKGLEKAPGRMQSPQLDRDLCKHSDSRFNLRHFIASRSALNTIEASQNIESPDDDDVSIGSIDFDGTMAILEEQGDIRGSIKDEIFRALCPGASGLFP